jgi:hypothetical protein
VCVWCVWCVCGVFVVCVCVCGVCVCVVCVCVCVWCFRKHCVRNIPTDNSQESVLVTVQAQ